MCVIKRKMGVLIQIAIILLCFGQTLSANIVAPVVITNSGKVRGLTVQYSEGPVLQYVGIPFAAPPIGSLRFQRPQPPEGWNDTFDATEFGPSCFQYLFQNDAWLIPNKNISEDCLQLNIYIPQSINKTSPKTVMIWIHGGGFTGGQATLIDGSYLALTGDVIVVTTNYRLGLFGFLSTEDSVAPGNYGLWDQHMAFKWVRENIASFGGDPDNVCIFGESAGGYSVGLHTVAPYNRGYFKRAVSESGAVLSPRALATGARDVALKAGALLNCSASSSQDLLSCLRAKSPQQLLDVQNEASESSHELNFINKLGPVIDGYFIREDPVGIIKNKLSSGYKVFKNVAILTGTNNAEGGLLYFSLQKFQDKFKFNISEGVPVSVLCDVVAPSVARDYYNDNAAVAKAICDEYTVIGSSSDQSRSILDIYAHIQFIMPTISTNMAHSKTNTKPTYHYVFSHQPSFSWIQSRPKWLTGANHVDELPFVFGLHAMYKKTSPKPAKELKLSKQMMVYWSNFAKTGDPNKPNPGGPTWPVFDVTQRSYMNLKIDPTPGTNAFDEKYKFWTQTLPAITVQQGPAHTSAKDNHTTHNGSDFLMLDKVMYILPLYLLTFYCRNIVCFDIIVY